jgi:hypothetical protein
MNMTPQDKDALKYRQKRLREHLMAMCRTLESIYRIDPDGAPTEALMCQAFLNNQINNYEKDYQNTEADH